MNYSQTLFSLPTIDRYRAAKANARAAYFSTQSSRGLVVLTVGTAYLQALALGAQVDNAQALLQADQVLLDQTIAEHQAGTAANLDELRARVQFQTQQQSVISAEVNFKKAKIALNREIGLPAEQEIQLTDTEPYADLAAMNIDQAKRDRLPEPARLPGSAGADTRCAVAAESGKMGAASDAGFPGQLWRHGSDWRSLPWNVCGPGIAEPAAFPGG